MSENINHDTYLFVSGKKLIISVSSEIDQKIYLEELNLDEDFKNKPFEKLDFFLNKNVFKIEKEIKNFIKRISVILDLDIFCPIEVSIKKDTNYEEIDTKTLSYLVYEAKDNCKKTLDKKKIVHMLITDYKIDNKSYSHLPNNIKGKNLSLDIKFITIDKGYVKIIEKILRKYQISLHKILNLNYLRQFMSENETSIFSTAKKIANGFNVNEVMLIGKSNKTEGFFEKFFNFFN